MLTSCYPQAFIHTYVMEDLSSAILRSILKTSEFTSISHGARTSPSDRRTYGNLSCFSRVRLLPRRTCRRRAHFAPRPKSSILLPHVGAPSSSRNRGAGELFSNPRIMIPLFADRDRR
jgi:hypothetical protein